MLKPPGLYRLRRENDEPDSGNVFYPLKEYLEYMVLNRRTHMNYFLLEPGELCLVLGEFSGRYIAWSLVLYNNMWGLVLADRLEQV